jgi:UDP-glucose 4-epimerase
MISLLNIGSRHVGSRCAKALATAGRQVTRTIYVASGHGAFVQEVVSTAWAITGRKIGVRYEPCRPGLGADPTPTRELFGWLAERSELATIFNDAWHCDRRRLGERQWREAGCRRASST